VFGDRVVLSRPSSAVRRVFDLTGIAEVFEIDQG